MAQAAIFWFTGLSGAGKTTLAEAVRDRLTAERRRILILDGDQVRAAYHRRLGFTPEDIRENNRLIAELCIRHRGACDAILVPIISPFRDSRAAARAQLAPGFFEIHVSASLETVAGRDVKGLYARAEAGATGAMIGAPGGVPYEAPERPDLVIDSAGETPEQSSDRFAGFVAARSPARALPA
jgi:adenylyl-sulfate kinase